LQSYGQEYSVLLYLTHGGCIQPGLTLAL